MALTPLRPLGVINPAQRALDRNDTRRVGLTQNSIAAAAHEIEERENAEYSSQEHIAALQVASHERDEVEFDETQLAGQEMMLTQQYGCLIGYAGTGKTTNMKGVLPRLRKQVRLIDWGDFRTAGAEPNMDKRPAIALCCFTNVAAKNLASKLPEEWAPHCMSIHSMLAYQPVGYESENGNETMRFEPRYTSGNSLPLDIIIIDEAGIVSRDLWENVLRACTPETRIYFLGDLAQLPALHGASPMPFAMKQWPTIELTKIYRQKDDSNIIPNLTRIRNGLLPIHAAIDFRCGEQETLPKHTLDARKHIAGYLSSLYKLGFWDPRQDIIITPLNGAMMGQEHWNGAFRIAFNPKRFDEAGKLLNPPILIKSSVGTVTLSIGDKVMATDSGGRSARERRFNNGSIGIVTGIKPNPAYTGSWDGIGEIDVSSAADFKDMWNAINEAQTGIMQDENEVGLGFSGDEEETDKKSRAASHIVTVVEQSTGDVYELSRSAEVATLTHAYAATCHKFQGSQARHVIVIAHSSMPQGLYREWLYTACSRAQKKVFLLHEPKALVQACNTSRLPGRNAQEKAAELIRKYGAERSWAIPTIPEARKWRN